MKTSFLLLLIYLALPVQASTILDLSDLKPVQYPLLQKTVATGNVQNMFIDFTASVKQGCEKHYGIKYSQKNILTQLRTMKFSSEEKSACLFPYLVLELNEFTKLHLLKGNPDIAKNKNVHLTLASRIYDADFLTYVDQTEPTDDNISKRYYDLYDISTHSAILYRMIRQTLEDAITVSNPWFSQNSIETIRKIRKINGWISEVTPWSYFYRIAFASPCLRTPLKQQCEQDKKELQVALMKAIQQLRTNSVQYEYVKKLKISTATNLSAENLDEEELSIARGLQVLRGLAGEFVPYMLGPSVQIQGRTLRIDLFEVFTYLENSDRDLAQDITPRIDKIEAEFNCKDILRAFISLQKETTYSLKEEMKDLNPFPEVDEETDNLLTTVVGSNLSVNDLVDTLNCKKIRDLYGIPLAEKGFITRFLAYQGRILLASTKSKVDKNFSDAAVRELTIYTQFDDVLSIIEKMEPLEKLISTESIDPQISNAATKLTTYIDNLFKEK